MEFENQNKNIEEQATEEVEVSEEVVEESGNNEWKDRFLRLSAEFENYKKRSGAEQVQWVQRSQQKLIVDVLSIVDDFERALQQRTEENKELYVGIELIYKSFLTFLKKYRVQMIPASGQFDPEKHEALVQVDSEDHKSGEIVDTVQKGFMMNDQVIRHAKVTVAK